MSQPFVRDERELDMVLEGKVGDYCLLYASKNKGISDPDALLNLQATSLFDLRTSRTSSYKWFVKLKY